MDCDSIWVERRATAVARSSLDRSCLPTSFSPFAPCLCLSVLTLLLMPPLLYVLALPTTSHHTTLPPSPPFPRTETFNGPFHHPPSCILPSSASSLNPRPPPLSLPILEDLYAPHDPHLLALPAFSFLPSFLSSDHTYPLGWPLFSVGTYPSFVVSYVFAPADRRMGEERGSPW